MFDFKTMGMITDLLKNRDKIEAAAERVKAKLEVTEVIGEAGGGAVRATVRCTMEVVRTEIGPGLAAGLAAGLASGLGSGVAAGDEAQRGMAEALIAEAVNAGLRAAQVKAREIIEAEMDAMGMPGLREKLMGELGGLGKMLPGGGL